MKQLQETPEFICEPGKINYCAYVDTDSNYIDAAPLLKFLWNDYNEMDDSVKDNNAEQVAFQFEHEINNYYTSLAEDVFNVPKNEEHFLEMKTECVIRSAYFRANRRYAQWITKQEGIEKDILDVKGLEFKKANFPPVLGAFFSDLLTQVLKGTKREDILAQIKVMKKKILGGDIPIVNLGNPTSVKKYDDYIGLRARAGEMFSGIKKGAPAAVKAAIRYNDLLRFWKLDKSYNIITKSDKVKWIYLKDNPYKIEALAFLDYDMPDKIIDFLEMFADRKNVFESILLNKLEGFFNDLQWSLDLNPYNTAFETIEI